MKKLLVFAMFIGLFGALGADLARADAVCFCRPQYGCHYNHPDAYHGTWSDYGSRVGEESSS